VLPCSSAEGVFEVSRDKGQSQQSTSEGMGTYAYAAVQLLTEHRCGGQRLSLAITPECSLPSSLESMAQKKAEFCTIRSTFMWLEILSSRVTPPYLHTIYPKQSRY